MIEEFVRTGKARFEYRHFPWHGRISELVAEAMECGADQSGSAFWALHDRFMTDANDRRSRQRILDTAERIGLDIERFTQCLDNGEHLQAIQDGQIEARRMGVFGTPVIFVGDERAGTALSRIRSLVEAANE